MNNIKIISDFIVKIMRKNILFLVTIVAINYHFIQRWANIETRGISFNDYLSLSVYTCIMISTLTMLNVLVYMRKKYDTIKVLCADEFQYFLGVSVAIIRNNFIFCCIPLIYLVSYSISIRSVTLTTVSTTISILIFEWFFPLIVLSITISFISVIVKKMLLRVTLSLAFLYFTSTKMLDRLFYIESKFLRNVFKSLNIFEDQSYAYYSDTVGKVFNSAYFIDKLIPLLFAVCLVLISYIILKDFNKKYIKTTLICVVFILSFISLNYISLDMIEYIDSFDYYEEYLSEDKLEDIEIESHTMNIEFKNKSTINDTFSIVNVSDNNINKINILLDNIFTIENISINSNEVQFDTKEDLVTIYLGKSLASKEKLEIEITYSGYINIVTSGNESRYIATKNDVLLPPGSIAWYPKAGIKKQIDYDVTLTSSNNVYSNLKLIDEKNNTFKNTYKFKGLESEIAFYAGEFSELKIDGINISYPSDSNLQDSINSNLTFLKDVREQVENDALETPDVAAYLHEINEVIDKLSNKKINNIIIAKLDSELFEYKDKNGQTSSIGVYHYLSEDTIILDK